MTDLDVTIRAPVVIETNEAISHHSFRSKKTRHTYSRADLVGGAENISVLEMFVNCQVNPPK